MIVLTPRQAELLSYLQGLQNVGEYLLLDRAGAIADLGLGHKTALTHLVRHLRDKGAIENAGGNLLRVLHRLEDRRNVRIYGPDKPLRRHWPQNRIRYAGFDPNEAMEAAA